MALVVTGRLNKQIAYDIGIGEITVKVHRGQVRRKMKAASLPDLARMADTLDFTVETSQGLLATVMGRAATLRRWPLS
jgi:hypothetical protein